MNGGSLLAVTLAAPLVLLACCLSQRLRPHALALQWLAPFPALAAATVAIVDGPLAFDAPALRLSLRLDLAGALLLATAALLWIVVGAGVFLGKAGRPGERAAISWLLTMTGSLGVFIADDLLSFYLLYALVSIPAYGMIVTTEAPGQKRAGAVYMAFTILGEGLLILAFAMLAAGAPSGGVRIPDVVAALPGSPWRDATLALIFAGFGMKMALAPMNGWMPLTYTAAPLPAAAVLSGAAVKAGVIGLIRFLPLDVPMQAWGDALAVLGFVSAFYGVAIGLTQTNPKTVLAYSSISQMGVIAAALGLALIAGDAAARPEVAFYAANHMLAKGALFLTIAALPAMGADRSSWRIALAAALALTLAGLPFTGGALAKLAVKSSFDSGLAAGLASASSAATALLMLHFLRLLISRPAPLDEEATAVSAFRPAWPVIAAGAILVPWLLYPAIGELSDALAPGKLWDSLWPILIGAALAAVLPRLQRFLPRIPEGDSVVALEAAFERSLALGAPLEKIDASLRMWPVGGLALLAIALILAAMAI